VSPTGASIEDIDKDPLVLLPGGALGVLSLDTKALFSDATLGKSAASLADKLVPLGEESGFVPSRDLSRVIVGSYALEGLDIAGVLSGEFDADKIASAARNHTPTKSGGVLVESQYAGHHVYMVANAGFSIVSPKTAIVGTEAGVRRALERLKAGKLARDLQPWMYETLETKGAAFALASDPSSQNIAAMSLGPLSLGFMKGIKVVRVVGNFGHGGVNVAAAATFGEEAQAQMGAEGFRSVAKLVAPFAAVGVVPQFQNLKIEQKATDVQVSFSVDGKQLADVLAKVPQYL
jgi:hypothetical protein